MKWPTKKRIFVCHCVHGLENRLTTLGSCMSFAKPTGLELIVIWLRSMHIGAEFTDLFSTNLLLVGLFTPKWPYTDLDKWDPVWGTFDFYNYMIWTEMGRRKTGTPPRAQ